MSGDALAALAEAEAHPLSVKKAMLAALLIDAEADRRMPVGGDVLGWREELAASAPALALVFELCAMRAGGPRLVVEPVEVAVKDYSTLPVEDLMVSLYNRRNVMRVRIAVGDARHDVHQVLHEAMAALDITRPAA